MSETALDRSPPDPATCANCGAPRTTPWCGRCGQPLVAGRPTVRALASRVLGDVFDLDRGLLHTATELLKRPGRVALEWIRGRTVPYTNPLKYFVLLVGLAQLVSLQAGAIDEVVAGFLEGCDAAGEGGAPVSQSRGAQLLADWFVALTAPGVAVLAGVQRLLFRRDGARYAEHLVLALFVSAQEMLAAVLSLAAIDLSGVKPLVWLWMAAAFGYYAWALRQFTGARWRSVLPKAAASMLASAVLVVTLLGVALATLG